MENIQNKVDEKKEKVIQDHIKGQNLSAEQYEKLLKKRLDNIIDEDDFIDYEADKEEAKEKEEARREAVRKEIQSKKEEQEEIGEEIEQLVDTEIQEESEQLDEADIEEELNQLDKQRDRSSKFDEKLRKKELELKKRRIMAIQEEEEELKRKLGKEIGGDVSDGTKIYGFLQRYVLIGLITGVPGIALTYLIDKWQENRMARELKILNQKMLASEKVDPELHKELERKYSELRQKFSKTYDIEKIASIIKKSDYITQIKESKELLGELAKEIKKAEGENEKDLTKTYEEMLKEHDKRIEEEEKVRQEEITEQEKVEIEEEEEEELERFISRFPY